MKRAIGPRTKKFIEELRVFCKAKEGRAYQLGKYLGTTTQRVSSWWKGDRFPTSEQLLGIIEWREEELDNARVESEVADYAFKRLMKGKNQS